jgi:RecA/RadA recombinase
VDGGYLTGKVSNKVGDKSSGKTFEALTMLAEAANNPAFDNYRLVFDDAEAADEFDMVKLFGAKAAERILPPSLDRKVPKYSHTIMDFQTRVRRLLAADEPLIYVLDSLDALTTEEELKHAAELQKHNEGGKEVKGTYGMEKAKQISVLLRLLVSEIKSTQSFVQIISQTRDDIDPMSFTSKTRAGGKALYFYCSYEEWLAVAQRLSTKVNDRPRPIGVVSRSKFTKNKATGKVREVDVPVYYDYGVDDIGSCIDFLLNEKQWTKNDKGFITATPLCRAPVQRGKLITQIEEEELTPKLHALTQQVWLEIEDKLKLKRKPKYGDAC